MRAEDPAGERVPPNLAAAQEQDPSEREGMAASEMTLETAEVEQDRAVLRFLLLLGLGIVGVLGVRFTPLGEIINLTQLHAFFSELAREPYAPVVYVLSFALGLGLAFPASPFILVGGVVFGVWPGALYTWLGTMMGSALAFRLARFLGRPLVARVVGRRLQVLDAAVARNGFWAVFSMRLMPFIPFNLSNFAVGVTGVAFRPYLLATGLAMAPGLTITTFFANALWEGTGREQALSRMGAASMLMILLSLVPWFIQHRRQRKSPPTAL